MIYILILILLLSLGINGMLIWYCRNLISKCWIASEVASEIFTRLDAYKKHIFDIYSLMDAIDFKNVIKISACTILK